MSRVAYQIRVAGPVSDRFFEDFSQVTASVDPVGTTLRADLADQAQLNGLLDALRRDGLELLEVRREHVFDSQDTAPGPDPT